MRWVFVINYKMKWVHSLIDLRSVMLLCTRY